MEVTEGISFPQIGAETTGVLDWDPTPSALFYADGNGRSEQKDTANRETTEMGTNSQCAKPISLRNEASG